MTVPMERVADRILSIRGHRVVLDADLAVLYGVTTGALNQAVDLVTPEGLKKQLKERILREAIHAA